MERDKKGRFVKKADVGASLTPSTLIGLNYNKPKIKYSIYNDGKSYDQFGKEINPYTLYNDQKSLYKTDSDGDFIKKAPSVFNKSQYEFTPYLNPIELTTNNSNNVVEDPEDPSYGMNTFDNKIKTGINNLISKPIDKNKLAGFLDIARAGIESSLNNRIAERALKAEKPFLQDVSESHRSVYGDYRAQVQGEKAAAQLRNMASKPLTSDGALQQQMMMDAQIKGQQYIDQGNAQDEAMIKQTREAAWQQEKENQQQRQAAAMQNKQAMLMSEKNKANIENMRDSANISQVVSPLLAGWEQRLRNKGAEQEYYQDLYNNAMVDKEVWHDKSNLSPEFLALQDAYLTGGLEGITTFIGDDETKKNDWIKLQQIKDNEILRRQAALKGVTLNTNFLQNQSLNNPYGLFGNDNTNLFSRKKGGIIYKARLTKRTRDNDRAVKSIESSKKIAAKFLEKAIESLYTYNDIELIAKSKKKKKYQAGGGLPFVSHTPIFATSEIGTPKTTKSENSDDLTTKDILELLKDMDGLPADMDNIIYSLKNFKLMDPLGLSASSNIASQYMTIINKIKKAKANKEWYDKAYEKLRDNNALNELAITNGGKFIGINSDRDFEYFSAEDVMSGNLNGYKLLTNSNLLEIRANDPNAAFNSGLITEIANGIGMQQVTEYINKTIQSLGSDKTQTQIFGDQSKEVLAGLRQLQIAAQEVGQDLSISQLYEANIMNENQANQANLAIDYLIQSLPSNMLSLLLAKSGSYEGAKALITSLVNSKISSSNKLEFSPKTKKATSSNKNGSSTIDGLDLSPAQMLQQGFGEREIITIQDSSSTGLQVNAITMPVTKKGNEPLGAATLEDVATSQYGGILNFTNASMGGQLIPFEGRRNIAVDGSKIYSMYLPIDQDAFIRGEIIPDISLIDKVNKVNKIIKDKQLTTPAEINAVYEEAGLPVYLNDNGTVVPGFYRRFGVLNGTAIDNAFGKTFVESKYLKKIDDEDTINNAIDIMNYGRSKEDKIEYDDKNFFNFGGLLGEYDTVYQGTIFIPMSNDVFLGVAGSGETITSEEANNLYEKQQQQQKISTYKNPGQLQ